MAPQGAQVSPAGDAVVAAPSSRGRLASLASIVPIPLTTLDLDRSHTAISTRLSSIQAIVVPTFGVGPTNQRGRVSIERLLALRDYTQRTSKTRATLVCTFSLVPVLALALALECIPLASPSAAWREQGMFWIRLFLTAFMMAIMSGLAFKKLVGRALELTEVQIAAIAVITATLYVAYSVGLAALWTFPVPFLFMLAGFPFVIFQIIGAFLVVDVRGILAKAHGLKKRTEGINSVSSAVSLLFLVYPLYSVAFEHVGHKYQISLLLLLPFFKSQWKKRMCAKLDEVEDLIPMIMMFTIELFNALYLTTCMQSSGSALTTAAIIALDTVLGFIRMRRLHRRTAHLVDTVRAIKTRTGECDLLAFFIARISDPVTRLTDGPLAGARIRGNGLEHDHSPSTLSTLQLLECRRKDSMEPIHTTPGETKPNQLSSDEAVLNQTLEFLFQCEFMVLAEYIECAVPIMYAVYLPILHALPNGVFFGHVTALSNSELRNALINILVYYALESASFAVMMVWLRRHFGVSMLHLLAFVLDEHAMYVQANILTQMLFSLQFTIAHLGADFSFKFAWLNDPTAKWWMKT